MTYDEVCDILAVAAAYDRRTIGEADSEAWEAAVGDLPFRDARDAVVAHYRESREWVMPSDIRQRVKAVQAERLRVTPIPPPPPELLDDPPAYRKHLRESAQRIAEGRPVLRAIGDAS